MSVENQPNTILTVYSPFAWIEDTTATVTGSFIDFPTAQNAPITFPNTITANTIKTNILQGSTLSFVVVNSDLGTNTGFTLYTNHIEKNTGSTLDIGVTNPSTINIGTNATRIEAINIGTNMTIAGDINLGGANGTTNAQKLESGFISCEGNSPLSIGTFVGRTRDISIGTGMNAGNVLIGGALTYTKLTNLTSDTTLNIQQSDNLGLGAVQIGCGITRTGVIEIGSNTNAAVGSTGNVNIMCGTGRQEGNFSVLTTSTNRGIIQLGNQGANEGGINIFAKSLRALKIAYAIGNNPLFLGGHAVDATNSGSFVMAGNAGGIKEYVVSRFNSALLIGLYQLNFVLTCSANVISPKLVAQCYIKPDAPNWVSGSLMSGGTALATTLVRLRPYTTATGETFTINCSTQIRLITESQFTCVTVGFDDAAGGTISVATVMTATRLG